MFSQSRPSVPQVKLFSAFIILLVLTVSFARAAHSVTLAWDPNPEADIAAYRVHYGTASGQYDQVSDVGNTTTATLPNLTDGTTYFIAVTACNTVGLESLPSAEVSFSPAANQPPTVSLVSPGDGSQFAAPANITITASANDSDGSISRVEFYNGSTKIGEAATSPYTFVWSGVQSGIYSLSAVAIDNQGASTPSAAVNVTVQVPAPAAPAGLSATAVSGSQINLTWNASSGATSYNVKRSTTNGGPYTTIATGVTGTSYSNTGLLASTTYYYVVSAVNAGGNSANSGQVSATTQTPLPAAPAGVNATAVSDSQINLTWNVSSGATSYSVKRSTTSGGPYTTIASGMPGTSYSNTGLSASTTYYYVVSAMNAGGSSANSGQASATTQTALPAAPAGLSAAAADAQVSLTWTASSGADSYNVKRATVSGGPYTTIATGVTATSYTNTGLINDTTYYYVVSAVNTAGESGNSNEAGATPGAALPSPWVNEDIGAVNASGAASYSNGTFTIDGSGADISGSADEFQYVYQTASGDCEIVARIATIENTNAQAKAGVMIRETTGNTSRYAAVLLTPSKGVRFQRRTSTAGSTSTSSTSGIAAPRWIKLTRTGSTFRAYHSANGITWTQFGSNRTVNMGTTVTIGLAVSSCVDGTLCTSTIDNVSVAP